jgi:hypothetical protein
MQSHLLSTNHGYISLNRRKAKHLKHMIERGAERERWWMLFVGVTLITYRLVRKHQLLFERSSVALG